MSQDGLGGDPGRVGFQMVRQSQVGGTAPPGGRAGREEGVVARSGRCCGVVPRCREVFALMAAATALSAHIQPKGQTGQTGRRLRAASSHAGTRSSANRLRPT